MYQLLNERFEKIRLLSEYLESSEYQYMENVYFINVYFEITYAEVQL